MSHARWERARGGRWHRARRAGLSTIALTVLGSGVLPPAHAAPIAPPVTTSPVRVTPKSTSVPKAKKRTKRAKPAKAMVVRRTVTAGPASPAAKTAATTPPVASGGDAALVAGSAPVAPGAPPSVPVAPVPLARPDDRAPAPVSLLATRPRSFDRTRLQSALEAWVRGQHEVGTITAAVRSAGVTWTGSATADGTAAPDPSRVYRAMSVTKTVTAALILKEVEAGKLTLDGPLPTLAGVDAALPPGLTVRMLLRHRSGFVDYTSAPGYRGDEAMTPQKAVELTLRAGPAAAPDTVTTYVNSNYLYLGLLLEQIEHRPYPDLVASLLAPLDLPHTRVDPPDRTGWAGYASGGIMSNAAELAAWGAALFTPGKVLSPANLALMTSFNEANTGLGLWSFCPCTPGTSVDRFSAVGHQTAAGGMFVYPDDGTIIVMRAEPEVGDTAVRAVQLGNALRAALAPASE